MASTVSCKSCGGTDHARRTSKKCQNYLPPIRKRNACGDDVESKLELEIYTIKRGLTSALCPLLEPHVKSKLISEIRRDVRDLSKIYIKLGIFINYCAKTSHKGELGDYKNQDLLNYVYALKGKGPYAEKYRQLVGDNYTPYDGKLRSFIVQEVVKKYDVALRNNITTHAYSRLCRYFRVKRNDERLFNAFYKGVYIDGDEISELCKSINVETLKKSPLDNLHVWVRIQEELNSRDDCKSFHVFPQPSSGLKHVTYTSRGWHELLRRVSPETTPSAWPQIEDHLRELWSPYLDSRLMKKFGCTLQTDGVSVSLSMNRYKEKKTKSYEPSTAKKARITEIEVDGKRTVAVDPGSRIPLAVYDPWTDSCTRITRAYVRSHTLEWKRARASKKLLSATLQAEASAREELQKRENIIISAKSTNGVIAYSSFKLKWLDRMQEPYELHSKLTRHKLDKYIRTAITEERIIRDAFSRGVERILYGAGANFMNVGQFSGRKFKHDSLLKRLKSKGVQVEIVNEQYTSKACSECNANSGQYHRVVMNNRTRRAVCPNCGAEFDRDYNAAKNIFTNYKRSTFCRPGYSAEVGVS